MKKILRIIILAFFTLLITACVEDKNEDQVYKINIYALNDFHGAIFETERELGIARIGDFLIKEKTNKPDSTVILSAGDMFQGTAVSSSTKGKVVVDAMNIIGFDAMTLGNHEFDWGIEGITRYHDQNLENGEANFPFLAANVYQKSIDNYVDWVKPYVVIERGDFKIGVLGLIGEAQTGSILSSIIEDYQFTNQIDAIKKYVPILRNEENCDIVIVSSHDNTNSINGQIAYLTDEYYVDAVINGHTHNFYAEANYRDEKAPLIVIQSKNNGEYLGKITLEIDPETKKVLDAAGGFVAPSDMKTENVDILKMFEYYQTEIDQANEVLGISAQKISQTEGIIWAANTIKKYDDSQVGIVNSGGIRGTAFPINQNQTVTYGDIFKIMPFENTIVQVKVTGAQLKELASLSDLYFSSNYKRSNGIIDGTEINDEQLYVVATIDYVFEKYNYLFSLGQDINYSGFIFRNHLVAEVKESVAINGQWHIK